VIGWRQDIVNAPVAPMSGGLAENRSFSKCVRPEGYMIKVLIRLAIDEFNNKQRSAAPTSTAGVTMTNAICWSKHVHA
jgi:hypothetical protein